MRQRIEMNKRHLNKTFDEGYDEFILYCKARNLREATIRHYDNCMRVIYKFIEPKMLIKNITDKTVENFKLDLRNKTNENDVTMNTNVRALRAILYYFMRLDYMEEFKISEIKVSRKVIETYTDGELKILLAKPDLKKCSFIEYRNWVVINFLLATACRISTLINLKIKDLDFENDLINYNHTKNRKTQIVPMSNNLKRILIEYLQYRNVNKDDYLFCTAYGEKINTSTLSKNICDYNRRRGVMKTGIHRFRHTFAKNWILNGGDIFRLQKILSHSSMDIVKNYVEMFTNDLQKDFNTFNPLEQLTQSSTKNHISIRGRRK